MSTEGKLKQVPGLYQHYTGMYMDTGYSQHMRAKHIEKELALLHELHQASRQLLRYNGIDRERAQAVGERLTAATHAVTDYLNSEEYDDGEPDE
jgi:hypothetical protein